MNFSDLSTGLKVLIAPIVAILAFCLLGGMAFQLYGTVRDSNARVIEAAALQHEAATASGTFQKGLASFYRGISWTYAKVEQKLIDAELQHALDDIATIETTFGSIKTGDDTQAADAFADLLPKIKALRGSLNSVGSALAVDPFVASMLMTDVNLRVREIEAGLTKLSEATSSRMVAVRAETETLTQASIRQFLVLAGVAIAIALTLALFIGRVITRPIVGITRAMRQIADGALETEIPAEARRDEIGAMAGALAVFKDNARRIARLRLEQEAQTVEAAALRRQELDTLAMNFETSVKSVVRRVAESADSMQRLSLGLKETATASTEQATNVTQRAVESASSVTTVAGAAEELASSIAEIADRTNLSAKAAQNAADKGVAALSISTGLTDASERIGQIVGVIRSIAAQTNLLALNATIEAARAGNAGLGFAVVAQEVKQLATETTRATSDIEGQIGQLQLATAAVLEAIERIGAEISDVYSHASSIAAAVEQQRSVVEEISRSATAVAQSSQIVSKEIMLVREGAETTAVAAGQSLEVSHELGRDAQTLEGDVAAFLRTVRAA